MASAQLHLEQAKVYLAANRLSEAEAELRKAISIDSSQIPARIELALLLKKEGRVEECARLIDEVLNMIT